MSCCNNLKGNCTRPGSCPVRIANEFPIATGYGPKSPAKPAPTPDRNDQRLHLAGWIFLTLAAMAGAAALAAFLNK